MILKNSIQERDINNRKAKRQKISERTRFKIFRRDGFVYQYCGRAATEMELSIDHIIPISKGGTNDHNNLITACIDSKIKFWAAYHEAMAHGMSADGTWKPKALPTLADKIHLENIKKRKERTKRKYYPNEQIINIIKIGAQLPQDSEIDKEHLDHIKKRIDEILQRKAERIKKEKIEKQERKKREDEKKRESEEQKRRESLGRGAFLEWKESDTEK